MATRKTTAKPKAAAPTKAANEKKTPSRKAGAKKTVARKPKATTAKTKPASSRSKRKTSRKKAPSRGGVSSLAINLGHVFALRPRVETSFRPADFQRAKHLLKDESYASSEAAARAVAEKALGLTHEGTSHPGGSRRGRWQ